MSKSLARLASELIAVLREHFFIEGDPPPPFPFSLNGLLLLQRTLALLKESLPPAPNGRHVHIGAGDEFKQREAVDVLRSCVESIDGQVSSCSTLGRGRRPVFETADGSGSAWERERLIIDRQTIITLTGVVARLRELAIPAGEERDRFIYERAMAGDGWDQIRAAVRKRSGWEPLDSANGVKKVAERYAAKNELPMPKKRKGGRRARNTN